jgi:hypothetical protein
LLDLVCFARNHSTYLGFCMLLLRCLCVLAVLFGSIPAMALDLYQGEAQVSGPDEGSRASGVAKALEQVLVKVSGDRKALDNPVLVQAVGDASSLMQRFEYRQELVRDAEGRPQARLFLIASFYPGSVDDLLTRAGLNVWGRERPRVLVLIEDGMRLLDRDEVTALVDQASVHGLSLRFVTDADVDVVRQLRRTGNGELSRHFGGGHVLAGSLAEGRFELDNGRDVRSLRISASSSTDEQLADLANELQQALVSAQLVGSNEPEALQVWVEGVQSAGDYARVLSYLGKLTPVRAMQVAEVDADRVRLDMTVVGGALRLRQTVEVGRLLDVRSAAPLMLGLRAR